MNMRKAFKVSLAAAATVLAVAACGGGGGGGGYPVVINPGGNGQATTVPATALASVTSLYAYMKQVIASSSDTSEPVQTGGAVLPVDNTVEPTPL